LLAIKNESWADPDRFMATLSAHQVTHLHATPSLLEQLPISSLSTLRRVNSGGEPLSASLLDKLHQGGYTIINSYGPTETSVTSLVNVTGLGTSIGRPIANTMVYVLDATLQPVPIGAVGELYIGGEGVARGYLNQADLTQERFIANPFQTAEEKQASRNARMYKTGDLVRYLPDGNLVYLGRNDFQVKLRGYRIELGEVETQLVAYPGIKQSVVLVKEQASTASKYLVGYYVSDQELEESSLLSHLSQALPEYMVPSVLVHLDKLPLTINGKLDRRALPDPDFTDEAIYVAPTTELEVQLCAIYGEVLGLPAEQISVEADFFRLGGNSILAIKLVSRINAAFESMIRITDIFVKKSVKEISYEILKHKYVYNPIIKLTTAVGKANLFMIHPGYGDSKEYIDLAKKLSGIYNCYGIDNFNIHHRNKISDLSILAQYYLEYIDEIQRNTNSNSYIILGWSFGGEVAFEVCSQLEKRGEKDIKLYLLDSFLYSETDTLITTRELIEEVVDRLYLKASAEGFAEYHFLTDGAEIPLLEHINDIVLTLSKMRRHRYDTLAHTSITLFKALLEVELNLNDDQRYFQYNNVDKFVSNHNQIKLIEMNSVSHDTILKEEGIIVAEILGTNNAINERIQSY